MTTKVTITNDKTSNGDVILNAINPCEGRIHDEVIRPGTEREVWITNLSSITLTETWPASKPAASSVEIISECGDSGEKWAKAFVAQFPTADEATMLGWFANAIEAAYTVRRARSEPNGC